MLGWSGPVQRLGRRPMAASFLRRPRLAGVAGLGGVASVDGEEKPLLSRIRIAL